MTHLSEERKGGGEKRHDGEMRKYPLAAEGVGEGGGIRQSSSSGNSGGREKRWVEGKGGFRRKEAVSDVSTVHRSLLRRESLPPFFAVVEWMAMPLVCTGRGRRRGRRRRKGENEDAVVVRRRELSSPYYCSLPTYSHTVVLLHTSMLQKNSTEIPTGGGFNCVLCRRIRHNNKIVRYRIALKRKGKERKIL